MRVSRRALIQSGITATAIAVATGGLQAASRQPIILFDSRILRSREFAEAGRREARLLIDVAQQEALLWSALRRDLPPGPVIGLTRWSDLVHVRGYLEEKGKRLIRETRNAMLFEWEMI